LVAPVDPARPPVQFRRKKKAQQLVPGSQAGATTTLTGVVAPSPPSGSITQALSVAALGCITIVFTLETGGGAGVSFSGPSAGAQYLGSSRQVLTVAR
jgi:hypothetical protein